MPDMKRLPEPSDEPPSEPTVIDMLREIRAELVRIHGRVENARDFLIVIAVLIIATVAAAASGFIEVTIKLPNDGF
jgi:hypothetical protein